MTVLRRGELARERQLTPGGCAHGHIRIGSLDAALDHAGVSHARGSDARYWASVINAR